MKNQIAAIGLLLTLGGTVLLVLFEGTMTSAMNESLTGLLGLLLFVFGIWSSVILLKK